MYIGILPPIIGFPITGFIPGFPIGLNPKGAGAAVGTPNGLIVGAGVTGAGITGMLGCPNGLIVEAGAAGFGSKAANGLNVFAAFVFVLGVVVVAPIKNGLSDGVVLAGVEFTGVGVNSVRVGAGVSSFLTKGLITWLPGGSIVSKSIIDLICLLD